MYGFRKFGYTHNESRACEIQYTHAHTGTHTDKPHQHIFQEASFAWAPISVWDLGTTPSTGATTS